MIKIKCVYDAASEDDGYRILIDRLWPRGVSKEKAKIDLWMKDIAPSTELRKWFNHDPYKWEEFQKRYEEELLDKKDLIVQIQKLEKENKNVALIYSAKDTERNQAVVLIEFLGTKK